MNRKFVYPQGNKAQQSVDESFAPSKGDGDVFFHLPVTKNCLYQLLLGLELICHSSYRGVVALLRDLFDTPVSIGTVHNRLKETAAKAAEVNQSQNLSGIDVGLHDEIFHADKPVLVGVDATSTYCYQLSGKFHGVCRLSVKHLKKRSEPVLWWKTSIHGYASTSFCGGVWGSLLEHPSVFLESLLFSEI